MRAGVLDLKSHCEVEHPYNHHSGVRLEASDLESHRGVVRPPGPIHGYHSEAKSIH
jgi:hypothetical protein